MYNILLLLHLNEVSLLTFQSVFGALCRRVIVSRTEHNAGKVVSFTVTFQCPTATPYPQIGVDNLGMSGSTSWRRVQSASQPVRGTYQLGFNGSWTAPLNWNDGSDILTQRLLALGNIFAVSILGYNDANDGSMFQIAITDPSV
jgi:hypothetical protein